MDHKTQSLRPRKEGVVDSGDRLLTPGEVAALFRVDPKTVTRWAAAGRIGSIRTPGGHRRFRESEVRALLEGEAELADVVEERPLPPRNNAPAAAHRPEHITRPNER
jgi:excisionase family DNA binding protein